MSNETLGQVIDGKAIAQVIRNELRLQVDAQLGVRGRPPGLGVILVGDDAASHVYVNMKEKAAKEAGVLSFAVRLPASTSQEALLQHVRAMNDNPAIDGILVQLPLPKHLDTDAVIAAVDPAKDVDGLHPENMGLLVAGRPAQLMGPLLRPCTPLGCMELLARTGIDVRGKRCLVVGRSNLVGKPLALLLLERSATVTVAHSQTADLRGEVERAEVVLAAVGRPHLIQGEWLRSAHAVIDVGVNRLADGKLVGDVQYEEARQRVQHITPVPGGVGPMTIAMLLRNTLEAYLYRTKASSMKAV